MIFKNFFYFFKEAFKSLFRNSWMSIASVGVVAVTLCLLGTFVLVYFNVGVFAFDIKDQVEILVFVEDEITPQDLNHLRIRMIEIPEVEEVRFVSRSEALEEMKEGFGDRAYLLAGYEEDATNPLRDSFKVRTSMPENVPGVALRIQGFYGTGWVDYGQGFVENLFNITRGVRTGIFIFMVALGITAMFLIANTIKLTVFSRSDEIMIMKYVGATNWFIRWPFLFEGVFLGLLGALLPLALLSYGYNFIVAWLQPQVAFLSFISPPLAMQGLMWVLLPVGVIIGGLGSMFSTHKFLKV